MHDFQKDSLSKMLLCFIAITIATKIGYILDDLIFTMKCHNQENRVRSIAISEFSIVDFLISLVENKLKNLEIL